jgi:hypothetical protein
MNISRIFIAVFPSGDVRKNDEKRGQKHFPGQLLNCMFFDIKPAG